MHSLEADVHDMNIEEQVKDNWNIDHSKDNQTLSFEEIIYEKSKGTTGDEMIQKII